LIYDWKKINEERDKILLKPLSKLKVIYPTYEIFENESEQFLKFEQQTENIIKLDFKDDEDGEYTHWSNKRSNRF